MNTRHIMISAALVCAISACKVNDIALYDEAPRLELGGAVSYTFSDEEYLDAVTGQSLLIEPGGSSQANVSSRNASKYLRPYQIIEANNEVYDGYTWTKANYLTPLPAYEIMLTATVGEDGNVDLDSSPLYQNPYWPKQAGTSAIE